jgi:myo-inositol-1(or 4)-monophosphatase
MKKTKIATKTINSIKVLAQMTEWAFECGKILNQHLINSYHKPLKVLDKGKQGLATEADLISEAFVIKKIKQFYPDHGILSEEDAFTRELKMEGAKANQFLWLIDPLDGTNNFYNKVPFFCVSLALNKGNKTLVGVVYNPITEELFYAIKGKGAYLKRRVGKKEIKIRLRASKAKKGFHEALLSANLTSHRVEKDLLRKFPQVRAMRRLGSAALEMSYVAAGMLDAYWEYNLQPWDMGAAGLICQEAGVKISGINGSPYHPFEASVLVAHPTLYSELASILGR